MAEEKAAVIILFGGSGDLARRKLYPAMFGLYQRGFLQDRFAVIGTARRPWSDDYYRDIVTNAVKDQPGATPETAEAFATHFYYQSHDVTDAAHYITLKELAAKLDAQYHVGGNRLYYMAMAPNFFSTIAEHLKSESLLTATGFNRLVIEKPFGHDYQSAKALNESITATFAEKQIYRIDHYLGKEMTQAIMGLRFANPLVAAAWNKEHIQNIQITLAEAVGVEERAGYYENSGAMRDMVQNHVMQLLAYLTMARPQSLTPEAVHAVKGAVFDHLHSYSQKEALANFVRAQYAPAVIDKLTVAGYRDEAGVSQSSLTETFVAGKLMVDTPEFAGVPIYIRTGKRLTRKSTQISVVFKPVAHDLFGTQAKANVLTIYVEPSEGFSLTLNGKVLGQSTELMPEELRFRHDERAAKAAPEAYERLIQDALQGNQTNFTRWTELSQTWQFVDTIIAAWQTTTAMPTYPAGTMGPKEATELLARDGNQWVWQPTRVQLAD
ncbi:glucose-6-phosphate dehydrogenase [Lacticaseibacillus baoqingensis]|uniref:Glucose-6-phosphate 1-dehydrogenase n=1 Tax=Lacticaseibacillus baoqingensis TaxID=2486013 RepID=A0ABW4E7X5_9LACO|nr:glucose-6-phosphate dehydrogenase [Lacticaseibacillus baoqingensis]